MASTGSAARVEYAVFLCKAPVISPIPVLDVPGVLVVGDKAGEQLLSRSLERRCGCPQAGTEIKAAGFESQVGRNFKNGRGAPGFLSQAEGVFRCLCDSIPMLDSAGNRVKTPTFCKGLGELSNARLCCSEARPPSFHFFKQQFDIC